MTFEEYLAIPLTCSDCGRTEIVDRWDMLGASCDNEPEDISPDASEDSHMFCIHCHNPEPLPPRRRQLFY